MIPTVPVVGLLGERLSARWGWFVVGDGSLMRGVLERFGEVMVVCVLAVGGGRSWAWPVG